MRLLLIWFCIQACSDVILRAWQDVTWQEPSKIAWLFVFVQVHIHLQPVIDRMARLWLECQSVYCFPPFPWKDHRHDWRPVLLLLTMVVKQTSETASQYGIGRRNCHVSNGASSFLRKFVWYQVFRIRPIADRIRFDFVVKNKLNKTATTKR